MMNYYFSGDDSDQEHHHQDQTWSRVEVSLLERHHDRIIFIYDPVSRWIIADIVPDHDNKTVSTFIASFLFKSFSCFGFPDHVDLCNLTTSQHDLITEEYSELVSSVTDLVPELKNCSTKFSSSSSSSFEIPPVPSSDLNTMLLTMRLMKNKAGVSPFETMFRRRAVRCSNITIPRRKLQSSVLNCRHCDESFTSKISFRIHQRRHTEEARLRGRREGEAATDDKTEDDGGEASEKKETDWNDPGKVCSKKRKPGVGRNKLLKRRRLAKLSEKWTASELSTDQHQEEVSERAADAVHELLKATREERMRRGKYLRYTPQLRDEIAEFALNHGPTSAAQHFSHQLSTQISESTVRNFVRDLQTFPRHTRLEIGAHAADHGLEATTRVFSARLGQEVSRSMVKRFRKQFQDTSDTDITGHSAGGGQVYSEEVRQEIGEYAGLHGDQAAARVFTEKLLIPVKVSTVRKFRQQFGHNHQTPHDYVQLSETSSTTIDLLHSSLDVLNQQSCSSYLPGPSSVNSSEVMIKTEQDQKRVGKSKMKREGRKMSRGRYVQYSDELRARIGKFALTHGNTAAIKHFYSELGHEIPESTIRGMKDKYQVTLERSGGDQVTQVGAAPRGRPASLGPLDSLVQDAVLKLEERGEQITTFLVIAAAKQVIMSRHPQLLEDNSVKLNTTWAKSLIRRLGVKNKKSL